MPSTWRSGKDRRGWAPGNLLLGTASRAWDVRRQYDALSQQRLSTGHRALLVCGTGIGMGAKCLRGIEESGAQSKAKLLAEGRRKSKLMEDWAAIVLLGYLRDVMVSRL